MRIFKRTFSLLSVSFLLVAAVFLFFFVTLVKGLPNPESFDTRQITQSTKIYDRAEKTLLYEVYGEEKRTIIPYSEIPDYAKNAAIAIEDENFYNHTAFDWRSMTRALLANLKHGRIVQGGSTITQQLAKNVFLSSEKTLTRKVKELVLSFQLEKRYTKDKILDLYLNQIPYGTNAYGIEAASQTYFDKPAKEISLAEAALLASLPKAPSYYSPYGAHTDELLQRKGLVLEKMLSLGYISEEEKTAAAKEKIEFAPQAQGIKAPHFVHSVIEYLNNRYGEDYVRSAGLKVVTTVDWDLQQIAEKAITEGAQRNTELYQGKNAALVAQDSKTGQILALVGSKDYFDTENEGNFNVATQGLRQPGSSIKPFAYITAFKKGFTPETILFDLETEFDTTGIEDKSYKPANFDEQFRGPITMRQALAQSINVPSVKTLYLAGIGPTLKTAQDFGITTLTEKSRYGLSLALGGGEVKLFDLVGAYSVFSQEGIKHNQVLVLKITDSNNKTLEEYQDKYNRVIDAQYPRLINDILSDIDARRPLFQNSLGLTIYSGYEVALKTGTTNDYRDAWAMGYTPSLVVGVWAGNNDNQPMQKKGGSILAAVPIWHDFMVEALKTQPSETFARPDQIYADKPILNGQYVINNQIHDTLYYINKNNPLGPAPTDPSADSQFENWEKVVLEWVQQNPSVIQLAQSQANLATNAIVIDLNSPHNGDFVSSPMTVDAKIKSPTDISKIEIYFNNQLVLQNTGNFGKDYAYQYQISPDLELQNLFKFKVYNISNQTLEKEVIVFKR